MADEDEGLRTEAAGPTPSVRATFDGRETGDRYHVTTTVNGRAVEFRKPLPDPFVRQTVYVSLRDVARGLLLDGRLVVEVTVGADPELMNDVLELDDNTLIAGRTRKAAFHSHLSEAMSRFVGDDVD